MLLKTAKIVNFLRKFCKQKRIKSEANYMRKIKNGSEMKLEEIESKNNNRDELEFFLRWASSSPTSKINTPFWFRRRLPVRLPTLNCKPSTPIHT